MPGSSPRAGALARALVVSTLCAAPTLAWAQEPADAPPSADDEPAPEGAEAPPTATAAGPAVEVRPLKRARHNWYAGFGFGLGAGNLRLDDAGTNRASFALIGNLRGGGRLREGLLLGGMVATTLGGARRGQTLLSGLAEVIGYPIKGKGLQLLGALGAGLFVQGETSVSTMTMTGTTTVKDLALGIAFGAGVGYEFWLARRFNLGLIARADGLASLKLGVRAAGTVGLSFAWY